MYSIDFPDMFSSAKTNLLLDKEATLNNLQLLLLSDRWSLLGDPYYGASFKKAIFEQNNVILRDLIVDEIYTVILLFMPQVKVERRNIKVRSDKQYLYADVEVLYKPDNTINLYTLVMTTNDAIA